MIGKVSVKDFGQGLGNCKEGSSSLFFIMAILCNHWQFVRVQIDITFDKP